MKAGVGTRDQENLLCSLRKGVPGAKENRHRRWSSLRHESPEESVHRAKEEDDGAHEDGETSSGGRTRQSFFSYVALRLSDGREAPFDFR